MHTEERLRSIIENVERQLDKLDIDPLQRAFPRLLFERGVTDDLAAYSVDDLAQLSTDAFAFFSDRVTGKTKIRISNPEADSGSRLGSVTVIEIINDDMPFLLDSALGVLNDNGIGIELVLHPILAVERDAGGKLIGVRDSASPQAAGMARESFIYFHVGRLNDEEQIASLKDELLDVFADTQQVVHDWHPMKDALSALVQRYRSTPPPVAKDELDESIAFLEWLLAGHFTFIGLREFRLQGSGSSRRLEPADDEGLGLLSRSRNGGQREDGDLEHVTPEVLEWLSGPDLLIITKANTRSTVHRRAYLDYVGVKIFTEKGELAGEMRIVGLFTSTAYTSSSRSIPIIRRKVAQVFERSHLDEASHSGKALLHILETFPRDELLQADLDSLEEIATGILQLEERPRTRIFARRDKFNRFVSALVYIPRDRFNSDVRIRIGELLAEAYHGHVSSFSPSFPIGALVRVHFIITCDGHSVANPNLAELEAHAVEIVRTWDDRLVDALNQQMDASSARQLLGRYRSGFAPGYRDLYPAARAVEDIRRIETLKDSGDIALSLYRETRDAEHTIRLKIYHLGNPIPLSDRLPILSNMGFRSINERTFRVERAGAETAVLHEVRLQTMDNSPVDLDALGQKLADGFLAVWEGRAEDDGYNGLILKEGLEWRDAALLRALGKYLWQAVATFSSGYMAATLNKHSALAGKLLRLFQIRFDPALHPDDGCGRADQPEVDRLMAEIDRALAEVPSLDEDRIIRRFANLIQAITRTNFFQLDEHGKPRHTISFKIDSRRVDGLPEPKPFAEIFVYAPDMEGVHLRGGRIARGGIRWSDRPADFRTEVLGLVKAQNVKNAVIVPVGAKGGFVCKKMPTDASREQIQAEGIRCYRLLISSMLDLTDNITAHGVVHPPRTVRHDDPDPYLVVAADKGTATFSDIANSISEERGFWLGDAFASGGSAGYDHKKMGITARGGWEAVKRHFREMDIDIQSQPFTVIGVGDMSGDVFGNGMLLSRKIRLLAAFDHRDIFIDPNPDPETSWQERARLFALPRSSWQDYSRELISDGGGVFSRQAKSIPLTPQMQELTGIAAGSASPQEVIRALLRAEVDLIWFGGIGTYIRASDESDAAVGDRANDAIRVAAQEVRAKVIGEGANLGVTQLGRIEFALKGGRINTDAVDNSAGVNSSDLEVNIKIATGPAEMAGKISREERNRLLAEMTDEVAAHVLVNNYRQTLCLTVAQQHSAEELAFYQRMMQTLERKGLLNRALEFLPDERQLRTRQSQGTGLTRPELAVLMAYAKLVLFDDILDSPLPDDAYLARELEAYFPRQLNQRFPEEVRSHRLRREIIATALANSVINDGGPAFVSRLQDEVGTSPETLVAAYVVARDSFGFTALNHLVDSLDNRIPSALQINLYRELQQLLRLQTMWFLRNEQGHPQLEALIEQYRSGIEKVAAALHSALPEATKADWDHYIRQLVAEGVPEETAIRLCQARYLYRGADIVAVAQRAEAPIADVTRTFFLVGHELHIDDLIKAVAGLHVSDYYDRLAINHTVAAIFATHRDLVTDVLGRHGAKGWPEWQKRHADAIGRTVGLISEMLSTGNLTLARLSVTASHLQELQKSDAVAEARTGS